MSLGEKGCGTDTRTFLTYIDQRNHCKPDCACICVCVRGCVRMDPYMYACMYTANLLFLRFRRKGTRNRHARFLSSLASINETTGQPDCVCVHIYIYMYVRENVFMDPCMDVCICIQYVRYLCFLGEEGCRTDTSSVLTYIDQGDCARLSFSASFRAARSPPPSYLSSSQVN